MLGAFFVGFVPYCGAWLFVVGVRKNNCLSASPDRQGYEIGNKSAFDKLEFVKAFLSENTYSFFHSMGK